MAAAVYGTDLATFELAEGVAWAEVTAVSWTALGTFTTGDSDDFIQGTVCNSAAVKTGVGGLMANFGSGITIPTDGAVLSWVKYDAAGGLDTAANGGIRTIVGNSLAAFNYFNHHGSDTYPYGGWINLATGDPAAVTPSGNVATPSTTKQYFGWTYNAPVNIPSKGNPYKADAIRYGRCEIRANGGDVGNGYATFTGMAAKNDANDAGAGFNRWGLFQFKDGSYTWKGLMTLGYTSAVDFRDSNKTIFVDNTKFVTAAFNNIEIRQTTSRVDWTSISMQSLGNVSKGRFSVIDNATVNLVSCSFSDMNSFAFLGNTIVTSTSFNRCGQVSPNAATMTSCVFDTSADATGAVVITSSAIGNNLSYCTFKNNTKAIRITANGTYNFSGHTFSNNTTQVDFTGAGTCTINPSNGSTVAQANCIATGGGTITVNAASVNLSIKVVDSNNANIVGDGSTYGARVAMYKSSDNTELISPAYTNSTGSVTGTFIFTSDTNMYVRVRYGTGGNRYLPVDTSGTITSSGYATTITMFRDPVAV